MAGKQKGKGDDRYLWPEMLRVVRELAPRWVIGENVPGILRLAAADVVQDLEREGYHVVVFDFEAAAVGAPHRRERIAFVANRDGKPGRTWRAEPAGQQRQAGLADGSAAVGDTKHNGSSAAAVAGSAETVIGNSPQGAEPALKPSGAGLPGNDASLAHADRERCEKRFPAAVAAQAGFSGQPDHADNVPDPDNWSGAVRRNGELPAVEGERAGGRNHAGGAPQHGGGQRGPVKPGLGGVADGLPNWMDGVRAGWVNGSWENGIPRIAEGVENRVNRLKCLGNAVVPQQFYPIFRAIAEIERSFKNGK